MELSTFTSADPLSITEPTSTAKGAASGNTISSSNATAHAEEHKVVLKAKVNSLDDTISEMQARLTAKGKLHPQS